MIYSLTECWRNLPKKHINKLAMNYRAIPYDKLP